VIKRVAGVQGDEVPESVRDAVSGAVTVPAGMLVVLGDSPGSIDSRAWGFLPASQVLGTVVRRLPRSPGLGGRRAVQAIALDRSAAEATRSIRIDVLGPLEIIVNDRPIQLSGQRQRALLAALAMAMGKAVAVDSLVEVLWDTTPPVTARAKVQSHVSGLRAAIGHDVGGLEGPLLTRPPGYSLRSDGVELDLATFDTLTAQAEKAAGAGHPAAAAELLGSALALWRGNAFADVESLLIRSSAAKLEERRLLAMEAKAEADIVLGRCNRVVAELSTWLDVYPFRERMRAMLMLALYRVGCRADALGRYRDGHQIMVAELGLEPGPHLRMLHRRILADDPALLAQAPPQG
jgi:DNA-binding SARP family transcriptional activator